MIGPGIPNPMMFAGGDPLDEFGKIERSVRLRDAASAYFSRVWTATGSRTKWTARALIKRSKLTAFQILFGVDQGGGNYDRWAFQAGDAIEYNNGAAGSQLAITSRLFRDPAQWADVVVNYDSANATQADRCIITVDGIRQATPTNAFALNQQSSINVSGANHLIGGISYFGGYLTHFCFIDNAVVPASTFGAFHPRTGQWRPKSKAAIRAAVAAGGGARNGWGTNGFFLPFDDATSTTTLGYDRSQSDTDTTGNNFTATNISVTAGLASDCSPDTSTNNCVTFNPLVSNPGPGLVPIALAVGNTYGGSSTLSDKAAITSVLMPTGRWQYEFPFSYLTSGIVSFGAVRSSDYGLGAHYFSNGQIYKNGSLVTTIATFTAADLIGMVVDVSAQAVEFYKNGTLVYTATGVTGTDLVRFYASNSAGASIVSGQVPFTYPVADAKALTTKNLKLPSVPKASGAFAAVSDSGANIQAALAAARPGWTNYIDIFKRTDPTAEGWRWRFSDDMANYLDSSNTNAKAAFPSLAGTAYVGYSLKVSATNGIATGRLTHVNGVADVVSDGLSNARKMVILKNEATGVWYVSHPDLTAGKLLYLEQKTIETADSTINSVTASGFTVASALASGTYRWVSIAEVEGFSKLWKMTGNGVTLDGPFFSVGFAEAFDLCKRTDVAAPWSAHDSRRSANPNFLELQLNATQGENGATDPDPANIDLVSNGKKIRTVMSDTNAAYSNASGGIYVGLSFAAFPFRYANAR